MPGQIRPLESQQGLCALRRAQHAFSVLFFLILSVTNSFSQAGAPPTLISLTLSPTSVIGGAGSTGTVTLNGVAPVGGVVVTLASSNPAVAAVPASVTVTAGWKDRVFGVTTLGVAATQSVTITASCNGVNQQATLTVNAPTLSSFTLSPTGVTGGTVTTGTVRLTGVAPAGGAVVTLASSNPAAATVPASVTVTADLMGKVFAVTTLPVATARSVTLTASYGGVSLQAILTVNPPSVSSVTLSPASVQGGTASTGTVMLTGGAPAGGAVVTLASNNTAAATVPASVTVPAGLKTEAFTVTTYAVATAQAVTLTASFGGASQQATLTLDPNTLTSLTLSPASVAGGVGISGTVTLNGVAPAGGVVVSLSSSNPTVATVPASITVTAGWRDRVFGVTTIGVAATQSVTITASCNGVNQQAPLTVDAPTLSSFALSPTGVTGGTMTTGTVRLTGVAPAGGAVVTLVSSNPAAATVPASVTVPAGLMGKVFAVTTLPVAATQSVTLTATSGGVSQQATLTVNPAFTLSPTSIDFGNVAVDTTGGPESLSLTNSGNAPLNLTNLVFTGTNPGDFVENNNCGSSVAGGAQCTISVTFTPSASGSRTAVLSISHNATTSPQTVSLSGAGRHDVILSWAASATPGVVGYNVYRGTTVGGEGSTPLTSTPITGTSFTDENVTAGVTYYYVVASVTSDGVTSAASKETAATIPSP